MMNKNKFNLWNISSVIILLLMLIFIIYPLFLILGKGIFNSETGAFTFSHFIHFFERKFYYITILNSFKVTIVSTILAVIIGLPLAYMLRKIKIFGSRFIQIIVIVSYISPPFIGAYA